MRFSALGFASGSEDNRKKHPGVNEVAFFLDLAKGNPLKQFSPFISKSKYLSALQSHWLVWR
jgi:hypothetical protein